MLINMHGRERYPDATVGSISINKCFECYSREGGIRSDGLFVAGDALPPGRYNLSIAWSSRFGMKLPFVASTNSRMLRIGAWIHPGHPREAAAGTILLGQEQAGRVIRRTLPAFDAFFAKVCEAKDAGEAIDLEIG